MNLYILFLFSLAISACQKVDAPTPLPSESMPPSIEPRGIQGPSGMAGTRGDKGDRGLGVKVKTYTIQDIDRTLATWNFNIVLSNIGVIMLPPTVYVLGMLSNETTAGWVTISVGERVYCYQGVNGTKSYNFSYVKVLNAVTTCDTNTDKESNATSLYQEYKANESIKFIPISTKLNGIIFDVSFVTLEQEL